MNECFLHKVHWLVPTQQSMFVDGIIQKPEWITQILKKSTLLYNIINVHLFWPVKYNCLTILRVYDLLKPVIGGWNFSSDLQRILITLIMTHKEIFLFWEIFIQEYNLKHNYGIRPAERRIEPQSTIKT